MVNLPFIKKDATLSIVAPAEITYVLWTPDPCGVLRIVGELREGECSCTHLLRWQSGRPLCRSRVELLRSALAAISSPVFDP